ncbi:MAG: hypothetical protein FIB01_14780 [Gemmatimonadetes bacterium]|nr:hypothetical protein [Gemmatimonadota bacterium]
MIPPACELFRALLRRALGGRDVAASLALVTAIGALSGWLAARYVGAGLGERPSAGLLPWLLVRFPQTALYGLGALAALQVAGGYGEDARTGWTAPYFAAGGTRDRYIIALALAGGGAHGLRYLLAVGSWLGAAAAFGRPIFLVGDDVAFLPVSLLWLAAPAAFAAAALALTAHGGRAVLLMAIVTCLPWALLAALRPDPDAGLPGWLLWATAGAPPYPVAADLASAGAGIAYAALLLAFAWAAAPFRILRA